jgi:hypothetical protein
MATQTVAAKPALRQSLPPRCGAPSGSEPISVIAASTIGTTARSPIVATSYSTVPSFVVRCWQLRLSARQVGAATGEVGVGIVVSTAQPPVGAAAGEVGAGIALGGGDRQTYS